MRFEAVRRGARRNAARPAHGHQLHELGSIDAMHFDQTLGQSRHVACASSCMSMRTSLEEGIKPHRFAGIFPEQFLTEAGATARRWWPPISVWSSVAIAMLSPASSTMFFM